MPFNEADLASRVGRPFPGGTYTVHPWRAWLLADCALAAPPVIHEPPARQVAHPLFAWMAAVGAMGITWDEFFTWFDASAADGPMFGEHETEWHRPLLVGATYRISGGVVSAERKTGRRSGVFDLIGYELHLVDDAAPGDGAVARCWNSLVIPRRVA